VLSFVGVGVRLPLWDRVSEAMAYLEPGRLALRVIELVRKFALVGNQTHC